MSTDDFNMRAIGLMMSVDKSLQSDRKDVIMKALAQSLTPMPKIPWYKRLFRKKP